MTVNPGDQVLLSNNLDSPLGTVLVVTTWGREGGLVRVRVQWATGFASWCHPDMLIVLPALDVAS